MSRTTRTLVVALTALLMAGLGLGLTSAAAAEDAEEVGAVTNSLAVTTVDATSEQVEVAVFGLGQDASDASTALTVEGEPVEVSQVLSSAADARPTEVVVIVDTNARSAQGEVVAKVQAALVDFVAELPQGTSVALVSAGDSALIETRLTSNSGRLIDTVEGLTAKNGTALFNGLDRAGELFTEEPGVIRSVVVFSTGNDVSSDIPLDEAQVAVVQRGVQVTTVHYGDGESPLAPTVAETAGTSFAAASPTEVSAVMTEALDVAGNRTLVRFTGANEGGARNSVELAINGSNVEFSYPVGALTTNPLQLTPQPEVAESGLALFRSSAGLYLAVGLAFVGISLGVWSVASMMAGGDASLEGVLSRYTDGSGEPLDAEVEELIVQSAILQRAVSFSESFAEKRGFLARVEELLERAHLPVRAGEAMFFLAAITLLTAGLGFALTGSLLTAVLFGIFATSLAFFVVRFLGRRRFKTFEAQLPDTLQLLAGTLRAGYSLPQGLEVVSKEIADPMGEELRRAMTEARLGRDLEDSLGGVAERLSSPDFAWAVMAISIQREVGGNLNELLLSVADTMIARERLKREINALTAEGRVSAGVLSALPPGLGLILWLMNPDYVGLLFSEFIGNVLLGLGTVSALIGLAWMKKVITVNV